MTTLTDKEKKEIRIGLKQLLLEQGIALVDLSEYSEKSIADYYEKVLDQALEKQKKEIKEEIKRITELYKVNSFSLDAEILRHLLALPELSDSHN